MLDSGQRLADCGSEAYIIDTGTKLGGERGHSGRIKNCFPIILVLSLGWAFHSAFKARVIKVT